MKQLGGNLAEIDDLLRPFQELSSTPGGRKREKPCDSDAQERIRNNAQSMDAVGSILAKYRKRYTNELQKQRATQTTEQETAPKKNLAPPGKRSSYRSSRGSATHKPSTNRG